MMGLQYVLLLMVTGLAGSLACDSQFSCPSDGLHADPCDCQGYYNCHAGTAWRQQCAAGTLFDPIAKNCDWAHNVDCDTSGTQPPVVATTKDPGNTQKPGTQPTQPPGTQPPVTGSSCGKVIVCYYSNWAYYRQGEGKYTIEDIDLNLCTHLMYAFAVLDSSTYLMKAHDSWLDLDSPNLGNYRKFTALKQKKSGLKVLLALGGWNDSRGSNKYSVLVASPSKRQAFISHAITFLKEYGFDGLDLDWEYPGYAPEGTAADKANFATWVQEMKTEFEPHGLLLTAAVGATEPTASAGYDIPKISQYLDLINLMTYDMHGSWDPTADHQAPLYDRDGISDNFNCDYSVNYFLNNGAAANKLVLGVPVYGRSFTLSSGSHTPPAPASGAGTAGSMTAQAGFLSYLEICKNVNSGWTVVQDGKNEMGPYAHKGNQWVGYDDIAMARTKARYAMSKGLAGTMIWAIDLADFKNTCGDGMYPLLNAMKSEIDNCVASTTKVPTIPTAKPTTIKPTTAKPLKCKAKNKCNKKSGTCIPSGTCSGKIIKKGCKTNGCDCCVPQAPILCEQSKKCTKKGGLCQSKTEKCDGDYNKKWCKGSKCGCCVPN